LRDQAQFIHEIPFIRFIRLLEKNARYKKIAGYQRLIRQRIEIEQ